MDIRNAKREYQCKLAAKIKNDPKYFYAYVKSKSRGTSKVGPLQDALGRHAEGCIGVGQILNNCF